MKEGKYAPKGVVLTADPPKVPIFKISRDNLSMIALDPGGVTGWSHIIFPAKVGGVDIFSLPIEVLLKNKIQWLHGQVDCRMDEDLGVHILRKCLFSHKWHSAIVFEDFQLRTLAADLSPVTITAKLEHHLWLQGRRINYKQMPSMAKRMSNERLEGLEVYTSRGGMQHARDADRHIIMTIRRCMEGGEKGRTMKRKLWPHVYK
ncbi:resolvase [Mycobacterium phage Fowlmouth]|uniref:Resolvase n=1 Tax=Mycobacterium phage Fowlmouth TaxID=2419978 RepID=A0A3G2KGF0_9CAUD|nr:resolvase [Mycobacterium phage Fowlmouth]AYN58040.1 resolvase [Mycobacterium phage Fowlmouth]